MRCIEWFMRGRGSRKYIRVLALFGMASMVIILLLRKSVFIKKTSGKNQIKLIKNNDSNPTKWKYLFNDQLLLFSAYRDYTDSKNPIIRVFGLTATHFDYSSSNFYCAIRDSKIGVICPTKDKPLILQEIDSENRGWAFYPTTIKCPIISGTTAPEAVSIIRSIDECTSKKNAMSWVNIPKPASFSGSIATRKSKEKLRKFGLCILPPEGLESVGQILEVMELNKVLGSELVVIYDQSWKKSEDTVLVLQHYIKSGFLEIVDWHLPLDAHDKYNRHGQTVFLNDCLYRMKNKVEFVIFTDVHEFLVPHKHADLSHMIESVEGKTPKTASFRVNNAYILVHNPTERWKCKSTEKLSFLSKDVCPMVLTERRRLYTDFSYPTHSRCILRPDKVKLMTTDRSMETTDGFIDTIINDDIVSSYHYIDPEEARWWLGNDSPLHTRRDDTMDKFKDVLIDAIKDKIRRWNS